MGITQGRHLAIDNAKPGFITETMARTVAESSHTADAMRERLRTLAQRFSQAEIAKRAGVSKANVHRYLKAGKVPADFLAAVAREFGVSPAWLLHGDGVMLASQVTQAAAAEAEQLLEVVLKLNAVGHEKLAALQGDKPAQKVRELSDALARHEQLRRKLAARAQPLFVKLLNDARDALAKPEVREAEVSLASAAQLDRIVNQPQLTAARSMLEGTLATFSGDLERQRRTHLVALGSLIQAGKLRDRQFLRTCYNFCVGLIHAGRLIEAARTADAMLLLAGRDPPEWTEDWLLHVPRAYLMMQDGRLIEALPILTRVISGCTDEVRPYAEEIWQLAHFLAGAAARRGAYMRGNELSALLMALLSPDLDAVGEMHKQTRAQAADNAGPYISAVRCIATGKGNVDWGTAPEVYTALTHMVLETELRRRRGQAAAARRACQAAQKLLQQLEPGMVPHFIVAALHRLHVIELLPGKPAAAARAWLEARMQEGYLCLRPHLNQSTGHNMRAERR
jgi:transcriptional regulator with XRE-family HTH domain